MGLEKEKLEIFIKRSKEFPNISSLKIHNKIAQFLEGKMPELTDEEISNIIDYLPHDVWSKFNQLTNDVVDEINWNITNISSSNQFKSYLNYLRDLLTPIVLSLESATWFEEVGRLDLGFYSNSIEVLSPTQIPTFRLLHDLLWRSNRYYFVMYNRVNMHIQELLITKTGDTPPRNHKGLFTANDIRIDSIKREPVEVEKSVIPVSVTASYNYPLKTLKSLFKEPTVFEKLLEYMAHCNLVSIGNIGIIWRGFKSNRKYEVSSFYEALYIEGFLIGRERLTISELTSVMSKTFIDFRISTKTIANIKFALYTDKYRELLVQFTQLEEKTS